MMKYLLYLMAFFLVGCTDYDYRISRMPCRTLSYEQLPTRVQESLTAFGSGSIDDIDGILLCDNNDSNRYRCEEIPFIVGIDYIKLIDTSNNLVYRIEQGTPLPYIIYKDKLYLADDYNIYMKYQSVQYSEYELK